MGKPAKALIAAFAVLLCLAAAVLLLLRKPDEKPEAPAEQALFLENRLPDEVQSVSVENRNGSYTVTREGEGYRLHDIPAELVNPEYLAMLLDECSQVRYREAVTKDLTRLADYGLAEPSAVVSVTYTDGASLRLLVGNEEPVSSGCYFMCEGGGEVLLMEKGRSVRFTMPVEKFIDFIIVPPEETQSPLSELQDITFSGTRLEKPIVLKAVLPERSDLQIVGLSFGALTHLVVEPSLHEANTSALNMIADQLLGLMSEEIVDYNCTWQELSRYGFDKPWLQIDFDYKDGGRAEAVHHTLRVCRWEGSYIAAYDDEGVVYRILDQKFLHLEYPDLVLRWFVSPFISDVRSLTAEFGGSVHLYNISGKSAKDVAVKNGSGVPVDAELFRKFFNLAVSAASDGKLLSQRPEISGEPLLTLRYGYRNAAKKDDLLRFYEAGPRRLWVEVNGVCESAVRREFLNCLQNACLALENGEDFSAEW